MPNDPELVGAVSGALLPLVYPENWEAFGTMTPEAAAALMSTAFDAFVAGDCGAGECPPPTVTTVEEEEVRIRRLNPDTDRFEVLEADGTWVEPTGEEEIPDPVEREEATSAERICAAATNAADIVRQVYQTVLDGIEADLTDAQLQVSFWTGIGITLGLAFAPAASAAVSVNLAAFWAFTEVGQALLFSNLWNDHFTERYICCLKDNATEAAGVVTFNRHGVNRCLLESIWADNQYVLLIGQIIYIHSVIGSQGLDVAGGIDVLPGNCSHCGEWAREFNFSLGQMGWTYTGAEAAWNSGGYWSSVPSGAASTLINQVNPSANTGWQIQRYRVLYWVSRTDAYTEAPNLRIYPHATQVLPLTAANAVLTYDSADNLGLDNIQYITFRAFRNSVVGVGTMRFYKLIVWGTGTMPFSDLQGTPYFGA